MRSRARLIVTFLTAGALALALLAAGCADEPISAPQKLGGETRSAETLSLGQELYLRNCASCHGEHGDGAGPAAAGMKPAPRDFRTGVFKFAGAPDQYLPHDDELIRIVKGGLTGTPMRAWDLTEDEISAIIQYIKTFSPPGEAFRDPDREVFEPEVPPDPYEGRIEEAVTEGEELYHTALQCNQCHPTYVSPERYEEWEFPLPRTDAPYRPAPRYSPAYDEVLLPDDFLRHPLRSVQADDDGALRAADLYRVIAYGLQGPMPGFAHLGDESMWAIAHYVRSIAEMRGTAEGDALLRDLEAWGREVREAGAPSPGEDGEDQAP